MPPFRPANLNKRAYPGNASIIGPTCTATLGITTTSCCSSTATCAACCCQPLCLGCRCSFCGCPFCCICCSCPCTVCDRTIPSGRWKASEQYEARTRDAWGDDNCVTGSPTCLCCTNVGFACTGNIADCKGFFICCGPTTTKWFVAPSCTQVTRSWYNRANAVTVANSCMGSCGWFVPNETRIYNPGFSCRTYWDDSYQNVTFWADSSCSPTTALAVRYAPPGHTHHSQSNKNSELAVRAFRCTPT